MSHKVFRDDAVRDGVQNACVYEVGDDSGKLNIRLSRNIIANVRDLSVEDIFEEVALYFIEAVVGDKTYSMAVSDEDMKCLVGGYLDIHNQYMTEGEANGEVSDES